MESTAAAAGEPGAAAEGDAEPEAKPSSDSERDRRLGLRVIAFVITLCVLVVAWAAVDTVRSDAKSASGSATSGSGADSGSGSDPAAKADAAKLVQEIADSYTIPGTTPSPTMPSAGQAAVSVEGIGTLATSGDTGKAVPIASVAKTMTAYLILADHPLADGQAGPTMTVTAAEAAAYPKELDDDQSLVQVYAGEQLSERDALEALLLASADNVAKILARWDSGTVPAFVARMNKAAAQLGMTHTAYTDPSGLDAGTVSTAPDQIKLGVAALQSATLRQIVGERSASVPKQGTITNYNTLLGRDGVIGVKTGSTSQAQGCLLFAATVAVGGQNVTIVGAVLGQPLGTGSGFLDFTLKMADVLIVSTERSLVAATIAPAGQQVAVLRKTGTPDLRLGLASALTVVGWPGLTYRVSASGDVSAATLRVSLEATGNPGPSSTESAIKSSATATAAPSAVPSPGPTTWSPNGSAAGSDPAPAADPVATVALTPLFSGGAVRAE